MSGKILYLSCNRVFSLRIMKTYKAKGIVLHTVKYGDSSMVAYVLTDLFGRQNYMIQGVKKSGKSNKNALFQPLFPIEFEGMESPKMQLHRMKEVRLAMPLRTLPFDVRKSTIALFIAEVLYRLVRESEPNETLFRFVESCVAALDEMNDGVANFHLWFLVKLSGLLGFYPQNDYDEGCFFDIVEGRFSHLMPAGGAVFGVENARILHLLMELQPDKMARLELSRARRSDFLNALLLYLGYHLDAVNHIKSVKIFSELF